MSVACPERTSLEYQWCSYGTSNLRFRGPEKRTSHPYLVFFGGEETFGKYVEKPFPELIERQTGVTAVNFGFPGCGLDTLLGNAKMLNHAQQAICTIVQVPGAHAMSNEFYSVHPRRNDRFLAADPSLISLFPRLDFTEITFIRHLHAAMAESSPTNHARVIATLKRTWLAKISKLLLEIDGPVILLQLNTGTPTPNPGRLGPDPLFVDSAMMSEILPQLANSITFRPSLEARRDNMDGMVHSSLEAPIAAELPGPLVHREIALSLLPPLAEFLDPLEDDEPAYFSRPNF